VAGDILPAAWAHDRKQTQMITAITGGQNTPPYLSAGRSTRLKNGGANGEPETLPSEAGAALPGMSQGPLETKRNAPTIYGIFNRMDTNADGYVSSAENEAYLRQTEKMQRELAGTRSPSEEGANAKSGAAQGAKLEGILSTWA